MSAYYNEIDPFSAEWLRQLIKEGFIADGEVDERSIEDVSPKDLIGFNQHHFFAGIGVWSYALRLAGWPDDRPVWTGSCPCQPFSTAGKGGGFNDERHLWPAWYWLIEQCKPSVILGEQVASKAANPWFDLVQSDLEAMGYAFGCVAFPSAGVGAPHIRDRAFWVGYSNKSGSQGHHWNGSKEEWEGSVGSTSSTSFFAKEKPIVGETNGFWRDCDWLLFGDGLWRPVEPGTLPLVDGPSARVGRLRGYGNAINAEAAKEFIIVVKEILKEHEYE